MGNLSPGRSLCCLFTVMLFYRTGCKLLRCGLNQQIMTTVESCGCQHGVRLVSREAMSLRSFGFHRYQINSVTGSVETLFNE
jgi:hypothetical protein